MHWSHTKLSQPPHPHTDPIPTQITGAPTAQQARPQIRAGCSAGTALPLGGLEEGEVRSETEGGTQLAVCVPAAGLGIQGRSAAARGGGVEDEVAGEAEQREEELVQHRCGLGAPHGGGFH